MSLTDGTGCTACQVVRINGVPTHELGCPEAWRDYQRLCAWCGSPFRPTSHHQTCCDDDCAASYHN